ncbi:MAG TPA: GntR family transcriptional regulator [Candidatus Merdenecus merdavium]|nr:GntR family transcriptional regulator [Candidatus Merdenecus merdavium]
MRKKITLKAQAYNEIKEKIIKCEYKPGANLNEDMLIEALKIGRTPIRDALSRLEQEGLIEIFSKKGIRVSPLTANNINMLFEIRLMYEPYVIRNKGNLLSPKELHDFYDAFTNKEKAEIEHYDAEYFYRLDSDFHNFIMHASSNTYMHKSYDLIQTQSERFRYMTGEMNINRINSSTKEHCDILEACLLQDWDLAAQKMIDHLNESKKATFRIYFENIEGIESYLDFTK